MEQVFTRAQAKNGRRFARKVDKITGLLIEGEWRASYKSNTWGDDGETSYRLAGKDELSSYSLEFSRMPDGGIMALEARKLDGVISEESYIVGIQPKGKTVYMVSLSDNDLIFGAIGNGSKTLSLTRLESEEPEDRALVGVYELTNILA